MATQQSVPSPLRSLSGLLNEMGVAPVTGWRWRQRGWLKTIVIAGRHYVSSDAIAEFQRRAEAGEFSGLVRSPRQK
jgi:hypothetical protein